MAISKLLIGMCAAAFAFAASSCCDTISASSCSKDCDVWPKVQDRAEYGNPCRSN
ncbi:hypothetical protein ACFPK9_13355 [Rubritalea spongiae]|uniref:Uncharacterized protein n=1 Tax=Rubritalea spongiae TaxID=430797 RepID=A0ABW5E0N2_9BACT